ncbi:MAG: SpoIIIAC/SpoIIIAD family protein [Candidatus Merdivicinus sp.]|jgi:stage III sporulation protein AD
MDLIAIAGAGLVAAAAAVLLRQYKPEYAMLLSLAAAGVLFVWILAGILPALTAMRTLAEQSSYSAEALQILVKCLGVCYLSEIAGQICRESGQNAIASKIELAGRISVLVLCLPMFEELMRTALSLIQL